MKRKWKCLKSKVLFFKKLLNKLLSVTGLIPTLIGFVQPFGELFESAIHAAAKFTTEYKASETADEVDGVCDLANEVLIFPKLFVTSQNSYNF